VEIIPNNRPEDEMIGVDWTARALARSMMPRESTLKKESFLTSGTITRQFCASAAPQALFELSTTAK